MLTRLSTFVALLGSHVARGAPECTAPSAAPPQPMTAETLAGPVWPVETVSAGVSEVPVDEQTVGAEVPVETEEPAVETGAPTPVITPPPAAVNTTRTRWVCQCAPE